jgi:hypothetical protein
MHDEMLESLQLLIAVHAFYIHRRHYLTSLIFTLAHFFFNESFFLSLFVLVYGVLVEMCWAKMIYRNKKKRVFCVTNEKRILFWQVFVVRKLIDEAFFFFFCFFFKHFTIQESMCLCNRRRSGRVLSSISRS